MIKTNSLTLPDMIKVLDEMECPMCGCVPETQNNVFYVRCSNVECGMHDFWMNVKKWRKRKMQKISKFFKFGIDPIPDWFMNKVTDKTAILHSDGTPESMQNPFTSHLGYGEYKNDDELSFHRVEI